MGGSNSKNLQIFSLQVIQISVIFSILSSSQSQIVDGGIFLESHPNNIVKRVNVRNEEIPISEQSVSQVLISGVFSARAINDNNCFRPTGFQGTIPVLENSLTANISQVFQSAKEQLKWSLLR